MRKREQWLIAPKYTQRNVQRLSYQVECSTGVCGKASKHLTPGVVADGMLLKDVCRNLGDPLQSCEGTCKQVRKSPGCGDVAVGVG